MHFMRIPRWTPICALLLILGWSVGAAERKVHQVSYGQGKSVKVTVELPEGYSDQKTYPLIFALPPGPGNAMMVTAGMNSWQGASKKGYIVVSPEVLGPTLKKTAKALIGGTFGWMDKNLSYDKGKVTLAGISNGGLGAFHAALSYPGKFASIIAWPGGYMGKPADLKVLKSKPVWFIAGGNDKAWIRMAQATKKALDQAGAVTKMDILPGQGHVVKVPLLDRLQWIEAARGAGK